MHEWKTRLLCVCVMCIVVYALVWDYLARRSSSAVRASANSRSPTTTSPHCRRQLRRSSTSSFSTSAKTVCHARRRFTVTLTCSLQPLINLCSTQMFGSSHLISFGFDSSFTSIIRSFSSARLICSYWLMYIVQYMSTGFACAPSV